METQGRQQPERVAAEARLHKLTAGALQRVPGGFGTGSDLHPRISLSPVGSTAPAPGPPPSFGSASSVTVAASFDGFDSSLRVHPYADIAGNAEAFDDLEPARLNRSGGRVRAVGFSRERDEAGSEAREEADGMRGAIRGIGNGSDRALGLSDGDQVKGTGGVFGRLRKALRDGELVDPGRSGVRAMALLGALAAVVAAVYVWRSQPVLEPLAAPVPVSGGSVVTPSPSPSVTVYVTGKVREPGVLALTAGSRVVDAIAAAGGVKKGAKPGSLNLARRLVDGEQIDVGAPGPPLSPSMVGPPAGGVLSLNSATAAQLEELPGVGEVLAQRIIDFRDQNGGFQSVEQLREVSGIGERKYAEIKDKVSP